MKLIDKMAKMQREFENIYKQYVGVIGVGETGVHLGYKSFFNHFVDFNVREYGGKYPVYVSGAYKGTKFFAILSYPDLLNVENKYPRSYEKIKEETTKWGQ